MRGKIMFCEFNEYEAIDLRSITLMKRLYPKNELKDSYGLVIAGAGCCYLNKRDYWTIYKEWKEY
jgi:hypothetical protein